MSSSLSLSLGRFDRRLTLFVVAVGSLSLSLALFFLFRARRPSKKPLTIIAPPPLSLSLSAGERESERDRERERETESSSEGGDVDESLSLSRLEAERERQREREVAEVSATVEDDDEEEEEEEEEGMQRLRESFDHAIDRARKYVAGNKYAKAIEEYTSALSIANSHSGLASVRDILTLYNNRSAMYEKSEQFSESLSDIVAVLAMDGKHVKARVRKARILEAQIGKQEPNPTTSIEKADSLCKSVAKSQPRGTIDQDRSLPSGGYVRHFLESFPSFYFRQQSMGEVDPLTNSDTVESNLSRGSASLREVFVVANYLIYSGKYERGFGIVASLIARHEDKLIKAEIYALQGTSHHLRYNLVKAQNMYDIAIRLSEGDDSFDAFLNRLECTLKIAQIQLELREFEKAKGLLDNLLEDIDSKPLKDDEGVNLCGLLRAWTCIHRSSYFIEWAMCQTPPASYDAAVEDIKEALKLSQAAHKDAPEHFLAKSCYVKALLKLVHVRIQSVSVSGSPSFSPSDLEESVGYISIAKSLEPTNDSALILEADLKNLARRFDDAIACCDQASEALSAQGKSDDCTVLVVKANILLAQAMTILDEAQANSDFSLLDKAQGIMNQIEGLFKEALLIEPTSIDAMTRYAQLKSSLGDLQGSFDILQSAIPFTRSRDELEELASLTVMVGAQLYASNTLSTLEG